jgi:hypothetical protein
VWGMGVLLWEIWAQGRLPYSGMTNQVVIAQVLGGYRLPRPSAECPEEVYQIMYSCWCNLNCRPTFENLKYLLSSVLSCNFGRCWLAVDESAVKDSGPMSISKKKANEAGAHYLEEDKLGYMPAHSSHQVFVAKKNNPSESLSVAHRSLLSTLLANSNLEDATQPSAQLNAGSSGENPNYSKDSHKLGWSFSPMPHEGVSIGPESNLRTQAVLPLNGAGPVEECDVLPLRESMVVIEGASTTNIRPSITTVQHSEV